MKGNHGLVKKQHYQWLLKQGRRKRGERRSLKDIFGKRFANDDVFFWNLTLVGKNSWNSEQNRSN